MQIIKNLISRLTYESLSDSYRDTGFLVSKISLVCNNKRQKAYGFKWKFKK